MTGPKAGGHAEPRLVEDSQCRRVAGTGSGSGGAAVAEMAVAGIVAAAHSGALSS